MLILTLIIIKMLIYKKKANKNQFVFLKKMAREKEHNNHYILIHLGHQIIMLQILQQPQLIIIITITTVLELRHNFLQIKWLNLAKVIACLILVFKIVSVTTI